MPTPTPDDILTALQQACQALQCAAYHIHGLDGHSFAYRDDEARRADKQLAEQRAAVRRQALAKLTPIERHALGLSAPRA